MIRTHKMRTSISALIVIFLIYTPFSVFAKNPHAKGEGLPPGLQKKAMRGETLPPGWQKKLAKGKILDIQVYKLGTIIVPPDPRGILTLRVEDQILKIHKDTRKIINLLK